jgi:ADP-heptose:LPS heptosyltransferase
MTLRFLPVLEQLGATEVAFLSVAAERCLFEAIGGKYFYEAQWEWKSRPGQFDFHCSILSLLSLLRVSASYVPGQVPYMRVPDTKRARWDRRLPITTNLKVGLVWAGNPDMPLDRLRSISLQEMAPLFSLEGVTYFSLQKERSARAELKAHSFPIVDWMDECEDFMDTAALIERLDMVISVDSAIAHLTGALGRPIWMLNRFASEWRWMRDREDTVWYPSMRLFNQTEPRNWNPVIERIADLLCKLATEYKGH